MTTRKTNGILIGLFTLMLSSFTVIGEPNIHYMTEEYPPYNFHNDDNQLVGIAVDLLHEMHKIMGLSEPEISVYPWVRGYRNAQEPGAHNMIFSTTKTTARQPLFKWVGPIAINKVLVFCHKDHGIKISNDQDLLNHTYTGIRDDVGLLQLEKRNVPDELIYSVTKYKQMANLVQFKRIDCFAYGVNPSNYLADINNLDITMLEEVYTLVSGDLYFAFNKTIDDSTISNYQKALDQIWDNESLIKDIYIKYGTTPEY